jgi:Domain of unknown function (DUF4157)
MNSPASTKVNTAKSESSHATAQTVVLQRKCACGGSAGVDGECTKCREKQLSMQKRVTNPNVPSEIPSTVHDVLRSSGQPLDTETREFMEPRFRHDFSQVRVHTNRRAAESARELNALAYTVGRDMVFRTGEYVPGTTAGKRLLAHELTHVVQQSHCVQGVQGKLTLDASSSIEERDAGKTALSIIRGGQGNAQQQISVKLQRQQSEEDAPISRPLIEKFRGDEESPSVNDKVLAQNVNPSGTRTSSGSSPASSSVFYVSFENVVPPAVPDHSEAHPGPGGLLANRAGYTRVNIKKRVNIGWGNDPMTQDGRIPLYAQSVNVFYRLDPIQIFISSDYALGSCPYRVIFAHEQSHVRAFLQLFHTGRESLITMLNPIAVPTRAAPTLVQPSNVKSVQDTIGERLHQAILTHSADLKEQMERDRREKDAPAFYATEYAKCPASEW